MVGKVGVRSKFRLNGHADDFFLGVEFLGRTVGVLFEEGIL